MGDSGVSVTYNTMITLAIEAKFKGCLEKAAKQALVQGIGTAQNLVLKDTTNLMKSIPLESKVAEEGDGWKILFAASAIGEGGVDYAPYQEWGPKEATKRKWKFRPYLRPAAHECFVTLPGIVKSNLR